MPRLTEADRAKILADYHIGKSQGQIAIKYEVSKATVNSICKGVERKNERLMNDLTRIELEIKELPNEQANAVRTELDRRTSDMEFFRSASMIISQKAIAKVQEEDVSMADIERAQSVIGKGKENIYGKTPDTAVQINNDNSKTTYGWED